MADEDPTAVLDAAAAPTPQTTGAPEGGRDLSSVLEELDLILQANPDARKELRTHRTLQGIAGEMAHTMATNMKREDDTKAQREAMANLEQQMIADAKADPEKFAEKWLAGNQAAKTRQQLDEMRDSVEAELGATIGAAVAELPEFKELNPDEVAQLATAVAGLPKGQILGAYTRAAVTLIAGKRAAKEQAAWKATELEKEVAARLKEANAKRLKKEQAPSMQAGTAGSASAEPAYDPKLGSAWNAWYEKKHRVGAL